MLVFHPEHLKLQINSFEINYFQLIVINNLSKIVSTVTNLPYLFELLIKKNLTPNDFFNRLVFELKYMNFRFL